MSSDPIGPRARVLARNLPVEIGGAKARAVVADVDLVPGGQDGLLDLEDRNPKIDVHAARAVIPGAEVGRIARQNSAAGPVKGLEVKLLGQDRFEARGTVNGSIPFAANGRVGARGGKLQFLPGSVDLSHLGLQVHLDIPGRRADVAVPSGILIGALRGEALGGEPGAGKGPARDWPLVDPRISWQDAWTFGLGAGLRVDGQVVPLTAKVALGIGSEDGWLRFGLSDVRLKAEGADVLVDLATRTARASLPADLVSTRVQESAKRELQDPRLSWNGPDFARLEGDFPMSRLLGAAAGGEARLHLVANARLAAVGGKIQASLEDVSVKGDALSFVAHPRRNAATARISTRFVEEALARMVPGGVAIRSLSWPESDRWRILADLGGAPLEASGTIEARDGKLVLGIASLATRAGDDQVALKLDPASNLVRASVPEKALVALLGGSAPLEGMAMKVRPGGSLQTTGRFGLWKMKVPVKLDGKLSLGQDGQPRYTVLRTHFFGLDMTGAMRFLGLSLGSLDKKGSWEGNTLRIKPGGFPAGLRLASLESREGALEVGLRPGDALPGGARGIRFDGEKLEIDPAAAFSLPGTITAVRADRQALTFEMALDRSRLQTMIRLPAGVAFDGLSFEADPSAIAGRKIPGKLQGLKAGPGGAEATFALDDDVFAPLAKLPPGIKFDGSGFRVDPKQGQPLPGRLTRVSSWDGGLKLSFALTDQELKGNFNLGKTGVAWDGHALTIDPAQNVKGLKATGAAVVDGDLVVEVGDGRTPVPAPSPERSLTLRHKGRARLQGFLIENASVELRPRTPDSKWTLDDLASADIRVHGGKIIVPPRKLDELIRAKLGPEDYRKFSPRFDGRRLVVHVPAIVGRVPLALRATTSADGNLLLEPTGFYGNIPLLEWPQRLIGLLLKPITWLIPGADGLKVDLKAASGVALPRLERADATPEGLVLDFGDPDARSGEPATRSVDSSPADRG